MGPIYLHICKPHAHEIEKMAMQELIMDVMPEYIFI
jgi:hypothetical protein